MGRTVAAVADVASGRKVKRRRAALAVLLVAGALLPSVGAGAQTAADKEKVDQQAAAAQKQVDTASAEEARLLGLIDESTTRKRDLDTKVAAFDGQIAVVQRQLD